MGEANWPGGRRGPGVGGPAGNARQRPAAPAPAHHNPTRARMCSVGGDCCCGTCVMACQQTASADYYIAAPGSCTADSFDCKARRLRRRPPPLHCTRSALPQCWGACGASARDSVGERRWGARQKLGQSEEAGRASLAGAFLGPVQAHHGQGIGEVHLQGFNGLVRGKTGHGSIRRRGLHIEQKTESYAGAPGRHPDLSLAGRSTTRSRRA